MPRPLLMPWFLPLAVLVGAYCTRTAHQMVEAPGVRGDRWLLGLLGWSPLAAWVLVQFVPQG